MKPNEKAADRNRTTARDDLRARSQPGVKTRSRHRGRFTTAHPMQGCNNQQDTVRAHGPGFINLIGIDDEIFTQDGQPAGFACVDQILPAALKELYISEY